MKSQNRLPFYLAWQYMRRGNKWTLLLTILLMAAAFINLVFPSALFTGIVQGSNQQIIDAYVGNVYLTPKDGNDYISESDQAVREIESTQGVTAVSAQTTVPGILQYNNIKSQSPIFAINPDKEKYVTKVAGSIIEGQYLESEDQDKIIIGRQIAGGKDVELNAFSFKTAKVGEKVTLVVNGFTKDLTIKGIFYTKFMQADSLAFITQKTAEEILPQTKNTATRIIVKTESNNDKDVISRLQNADIDGEIYSWEEVAGLMKAVSDSFVSINVLMAFVGVLIAAVTIFIIIYVDIVNKRRQIGILRAIGIRPYIIIFSYVILAAIYATLGVLLGAGIYKFILDPYFLANPFVLPVCDAVLIADTSDFIARAETIMWVAVIAGLIPATIVTRTKMLDEILGR